MIGTPGLPELRSTPAMTGASRHGGNGGAHPMAKFSLPSIRARTHARRGNLGARAARSYLECLPGTIRTPTRGVRFEILGRLVHRGSGKDIGDQRGKRKKPSFPSGASPSRGPEAQRRWFMTGCLEDKALFLLTEGEASEAQRSHLQNCWTCSETIRRNPARPSADHPHTRLRSRRRFDWLSPERRFFYRSLPIAAGVLLAVALMWGESRLWRPNSSSEQALNGDVSQFMQQVAEAIDGGTTKNVGTASSDTDLTSLQIALGENCSDECRELLDNAFATNTQSNTNPSDRSLVTTGRRAIEPAMKRLVSDMDE